MPRPQIHLLAESDLEAIDGTSRQILRDVGIVVHHIGTLERLAEAGAQVDRCAKLVRLSEVMIEEALASARKQYILRGRDANQVARFGYGDQNLMSSPGQYAWFDHLTGERREPRLTDARDAIKLGDALPNVSIVGAMVVPTDVPDPIRDVVLTAELVKGTGKPTRCWPVSRRSSRYVLEIYQALAGGAEALRKQPMVETFLEPISPLQLPETGLDVLQEFIALGQPASIGPMAMASGTGPATLAGNLAQENAEILAGIVAIQALAPGTPVMYGGIPHVMDQRTSICSFGSPEQALMAVGMTELAKYYGLPAYVNVNLTDAKALDVQAGMEKMGSFVSGILAGADIFGHAGIVGTDHGSSLVWLAVDDQAMGYARRLLRGFGVDAETLASSVIAEVGPGGHYLAHEHTIRHFRQELWFPSPLWTRESYDHWAAHPTSMRDRAAAYVDRLLAEHRPEPLEEGLAREIDHIVEVARRELAS